MKLVSYDCEGSWRPGIAIGSTVFDVATLLGNQDAVRSTRALLEQFGDALPQLSLRLTEAAALSPKAAAGEQGNLRLGPPVTDPLKVLCIGLNYNDHVAETGRALPTHPDIFPKFASTLIGPRDDINCTQITQNLDFEGEMAVVIGRKCRHVSEADALNYVAGLTVLNDITARDLQYRGTQWLAGKSVDGSTPVGPALVTLDETGDPQTLDIATRVNGQQVQSSNTSLMIFPVAKLVAYISFFLELSPGDIITTGTPQGIGAKRQPPLWLKAGDVVEVELQGVGLLRNTVR
jgi:2-keto-4-pentenoate hydratase/2-oxohepta-3-ene-1,7-dioic acid hydratase in catechol pathway